MKEDAPNFLGSSKKVACPECSEELTLCQIKSHILSCKKYVPTYVNNIRRFIDQMSPNYIEFLISEMDIIRDELAQKAQEHHKIEFYQKQILHEKQNIRQEQANSMKLKFKEQEKQKKNQSNQQENTQSKSIQPSKPVVFEPTMRLDDLYGSLDPFKEGGADNNQTIQCASPSCTMPVKTNDIQKFTYLDQCLHTICKFCLRNYIRNQFVKKKGELKCPNKKCKALIPYIQINEVMDKIVLNKLEEELNSKAFDLIQCQKCKEHYQFQKGKPSDAPKKTQEGKDITPSAAKHYAENRFQCPKCKQAQCKSCKEVPYHLGFSCQEFKEHKLKKKCRYCRSVLPKGYMSQSGIHTFDDICDSQECTKQMKEACSKKLPCGHSCCGVIGEKQCPPCLKEECAKKNEDILHGQNQSSFCSLCYVESLGQSPCIQSKCGHIFHLKCLKKRIQLKWGTPRITFRFCQCPLCNKWLQIARQFSVSSQIQKYKILLDKIKEKALKRLKHQNEDQNQKLKDPKSPYYKQQEKYAMTIYAYFQCYQCKQPYFGGRKNCAEAMDQAREEQKFNPKQLICPSCCPVQVTDCKKHGKQFISFKCKFCCSVAQWFCWGNTHFCDGCHKKQISGQYISRIPKDKLPLCEGKQKCPVGGQHGGNGEQYCLGCAVCRGDRIDAQQF